MQKPDYHLVLPGLCIVATSYGLARYAYGLFLPHFRANFALSDAALAYIAALSYAGYFCVTLAGIYLSTRLAPRLSVLLGGLAAVIGMGIIALAQTPLMLAMGVTVAGVSPGLAYTPFSEIIATLVTPARQRNIYAIINSGTSLGVMISGPAAILLGHEWRAAWGVFALFGLLSTLWCMAVLPKLPARDEPLSLKGVNFRTLTAGARARLFIVAFLIGIATSIYWAFSVDLITSHMGSNHHLFGMTVNPARFSQIFWTVIGLAGFVGMAAGLVIERLGTIPAMRLFLIGLGAATAMIAFGQSTSMILLSGLVFGAFFVFMAADIGIWSLELFPDLPPVGFGLAFLVLSAGQFMGPMLTGLLIGHITLPQLFILSALFCTVLAAVLPHHRPSPHGTRC